MDVVTGLGQPASGAFMPTDQMDVSRLAAAPAHHAKIGLPGAVALVVGGMIGSAIFILPATMGAVGSISILGWLAAALAALSVAAVFAQIGAAAPMATGLAYYAQAGLGRFFGVQMTVAYYAANTVGLVPIALAVAGTVGYLVPELTGTGPRLAITLASRWGGIAVSWLGPRWVTRLEGATLGIGLFPVILTATAGWFVFQPDLFLASWNPQGLTPAAAIGSSALTAFYAFLGLECAAAAAGVVRDPARNVPRATLLGVAAAAALYIAVNAVLMGILPSAALAKSGAPFADAAKLTVGAGLGGLLAICAFVRAQGCLTGFTLLTSETTRSAADEGAFPKIFRTRAGERVSPVNLLTLGGLMSLAAISTATPDLAEQFRILVNVTVLLSLYCYGLAAVSLVRLSRGFTAPRRVLAIVTAGVTIACAAALGFTAKPVELAWAVVPLGAGALLYLWLRRR